MLTVNTTVCSVSKWGNYLEEIFNFDYGGANDKKPAYLVFDVLSGLMWNNGIKNKVYTFLDLSSQKEKQIENPISCHNLAMPLLQQDW